MELNKIDDDTLEVVETHTISKDKLLKWKAHWERNRDEAVAEIAKIDAKLDVLK